MSQSEEDLGELFEQLLGRGRPRPAPPAPEPAEEAEDDDPVPPWECPGCRFVRAWGFVYRAVWEAGDRYTDLVRHAAELEDDACDEPRLKRGVARTAGALRVLRESLKELRQSVPCFGSADPSGN